MKLRQFLLEFILKRLYRYWQKNNKEFDPRVWSNNELRKFAYLFTGKIINISADKDSDKEGRFYRDYFINAHCYMISNYERIFDDDSKFIEIELDLSKTLPNNSELIQSFDVVFSHTVLEHIFEIDISVENLCKMTRDVVITVVPFIQSFHHIEKYYTDYWRFSPHCLVKLFDIHGLKTIYISWNNDPIGNIYIIHIASKYPERWKKIAQKIDVKLLECGPGYYRQVLLSNQKIIQNAKSYNLLKILEAFNKN